jgi:hypothetical protein
MQHESKEYHDEAGCQGYSRKILALDVTVGGEEVQEQEKGPVDLKVSAKSPAYLERCGRPLVLPCSED